MFLQLLLEVNLQDTVRGNLLVGVSIHAESVLLLVIGVIKTNINVRNMANLILSKYSEDALLKDLFYFTSSVL